MRLFKRVLLCAGALALLLAGCGQDTPAQEEPPQTKAGPPQYGAAVPESAAVDDNWFSDTAMIGHSLMNGMELYSGLDTPDYYTLTGASVSKLLSSDEVTLPSGGTGRLADALAGSSYSRFYLFMGINEIAGELNALKSDYLRLVELVRSASPDASVYVLAVLPVTRDKAGGGTFTLERISAYNEMLQALCEEQSCWYIDLDQCVADEDGYLPDSSSSDGVHLHAQEYAVLRDYLKTHTVD